VDKLERPEGRTSQFPTTPKGFERTDWGFRAIDKAAIDESAIPIGVPVEIDGRAFIRFPCKDGHYEFSEPTKSGIQTLKYTPFDSKSRVVRAPPQRAGFRDLEEEMAKKYPLGSSSLRFLATKALQVLGAINLLSPYESAAFHDALQNDDAVSAFFTSLLNVLDANPLSPRIFDEYVEAVTSLPADRGRVATWPVATVFPYLAAPDRCMFLKPEVTKEAANSMTFDLQYNAIPNWITYQALLRMGTVYLELLRRLGARDYLDVQSFIYVTCGGYGNAKVKAEAKKQSAIVGSL
jgi:hypothetical protein